MALKRLTLYVYKSIKMSPKSISVNSEMLFFTVGNYNAFAFAKAAVVYSTEKRALREPNKRAFLACARCGQVYLPVLAEGPFVHTMAGI